MPVEGYTAKTIKQQTNDKLEYVSAKMHMSVQEFLEHVSDEYIKGLQSGKIKTPEPQIPAAVAKVIRASGRTSSLVIERKKSAPYRSWTGSEWFLESEPSNVQMLIDGYMPLFEKQQGTPILIEVEQ